MTLILRYILMLLLINLTMFASVYTNSLDNVTLKSASELDYPPFSIVTKDGKADGFSVELLQSVVTEMGGKIEYKIDTWERLKQELKDGKIEVLPVMGRTDERAKDFGFSVPYLLMHGAVFIRKGDTRIKTYDDLKDKVVVVMKGDNAEEYVRTKKLGKEIITFDTYKPAFKALSSGKYDVVIAQKLVGMKLVSTLGLKNIHKADFILEDFRQDFSFAVKHGVYGEKLLALLNEGLAVVMANGTYSKLYEKWFNNKKDTSVFDSKYFQVLAIAFLILFVLLTFYFFWNRSLKIKVAQKTMELYQLNESLEKRIEEAVVDLHKKDEIMLMQSRQAIMGEMISMIAHQWRQPISAISMIANNILVDIAFENIDFIELEKMTKEININTQELSNTIDDFRNFFKPNQSKELININSIMDDTLLIIGKSLENNNITIELTELKEDKKINTYPRELMQVFINILNNAKDALIERKIEKPMVHMSYKQISDEKIIITICDNAGGIKKGLMDKIFDPYFSTKHEKNGTGLGLYISMMIIEKHLFGKLSVYNNDEGACFKIELPCGEIDE